MANTKITTNVIADGAITSAKLDTNITISGNITGTLATAAQPNITSLGTLTGLTTTGDINFGDNDKAIFGAGSDLQIYHDGTDTWIDESGAGSLKIRGNYLQLLSPQDELFFQGQANGSSYIYHNGLEKLATTSTGIDVTGTVISDGLTATGVIVTEGNAAVNDAQIGRLNFTNTNSNASSNPIRASILSGRQNSAWGGYLSLYTSTGTDAVSEKVRIGETGNVTINSSGTIPTGVLLGKQLVVGSSTGSEIIAFREDTSVNVGDKVGALLIGNSDTDGAEDHLVGMWGKVSSTNGSQDLHFAAGRSGYEGDSPQMTLSSSGNVGIGKTPDNFFHIHKAASGSGAQNNAITPLVIENSTHAMIQFDTPNNVQAGFYFGDPQSAVAGELAYEHNNDQFTFYTAGASKVKINSTGQILANSLGVSTPTFSFTNDTNTGMTRPTGDTLQFVCGGTVKARISTDGLLFNSDTAAANALDDYEEGTWTPTITFGGGSTGQTYNRRQGKYIKIGSLVYIQGHLYFTNKGSSTGQAGLAGLPFPPSSNSAGTFSPIGDRGQLNTGGRGVSCYLHSSSTTFPLYDGGFDGSGNSDTNYGDFNNSSEIDVNFCYYTDA